MFIEPNSTIKLLHNVPLDPTYDHTIFFDYADRQTQWFNNYVKTGMVFERQSYQRHSRGYIKLEVLADNVYDCNYVMFRNTSFGNKWFYAFVTNVEYVNNNVTLIQYEIDVMQTWFFDYTLGECFVEREHSATDQIGEHLVPENLATGEYQVEKLGNVAGLEDLSIVLFCTVDRSYSDITGVWRQGTFSGLYPVTFPLTQAGAQQAVSWIQNLPLAKVDAVKMGCIMPTAFATVNIAAEAAEYTKKTTLDIGNYETARNKKTLTYPYNFLYVTNNEGKAAVYPYEYFSSETCMFEIFGDFTPNPNVIMYPLMYKGASQNEDEAIQLGGYPQIAFDVDSYQAWIAQSASGIGIAALAGAMGYYGSAAQGLPGLGGPVGEEFTGAGAMLSGSFATMVGYAVKGGMAALQPPQSRGTQSSSVRIPAGMMNFTFYRKFVRPEFARIIDDYFTMYGYACHKVKIPHRNVRDRWTYVKTVGCVLAENMMPADDARKVCSIYNNGITFWTWYATVGDYTQDNPCRAEMIEP